MALASTLSPLFRRSAIASTADKSMAAISRRGFLGGHGVGKLLNAKTGRSQFLGGIVWGLGMALTEETQVDPASGRVLNANLAQYHVPVAADIPEIEVNAVDEDDQNFNRSARAVSARSASPACRRPSPMPCITPPASASAICRSRRRRFSRK